jgi:hypothetical protein
VGQIFGLGGGVLPAKEERTKIPLNGWEGKPYEKDARSESPVPNQSSKVEQVKLPAIFYATKS